MTINQAVLSINKTLTDIYSQKEILSLINIIFEDILKIEKINILIEKDFLLSPKQKDLLSSAIKDLKRHKPIQYIIGKTEFYGLFFFVDKNVLIPRPETEELVELFLKNENPNKKQKIIDIATGSGCICVSIAKNSDASIFATDVSKEALYIAEKNAKNNFVDISFFEHNILKEHALSIKTKKIMFDYIISNPPYVRKKEADLMKKNVLDYEPHLALFVEDDNALIFYEAIAKFAENSLKNRGKIYLEVNEYIARQTAELFEKKNFFNVKIENDIFNKKRFIIVTK